MSDLKISELGTIPAVASADVLAIVDTSLSETNKVSVEDLLRSAPAGTAAAPSIAFVDDRDTGFYRSAANELSVSTAGSQRVVIDASGNVGIGTSSPGAPLEVKNNDNAPGGIIQLWRADTGTNNRACQLLAPEVDDASSPFTFFTNNSWNFRIDLTDAFTINAAANIGIRETSPTSPLHITTSSNWNFPSLFIQRDASNIANNIKMIAFGLEADSSSQSTASSASFIGLNTTNPPTTSATVSNENARLNLTSPGGVIMPVGNVGIGTSSAATRLEVARLGAAWTGAAPSSVVAAFIHNGNNLAGSGAGLQISGGSTASSVIYFGDENDASVGQITYGHGSDSMAFRVNADEHMRLSSSGQLLIGTSSARGVGASAADLEVETDGVAASFIRNTSADTVGAVVSLGKSRGANPGGTTIVQAGDTLGELRFAGADGADIISIGATIRAKVDGTPGADDMPGRLEFLTSASGASSPTTVAMTIKENDIINFGNCPTYADDTAAGTGGLATGDVYKTSTGELRIKL